MRTPLSVFLPASRKAPPFMTSDYTTAGYSPQYSPFSTPRANPFGGSYGEASMPPGGREEEGDELFVTLRV